MDCYDAAFPLAVDRDFMAANFEIQNCFGVPKTDSAKEFATQQFAQLRKHIEAKKWSGVRLKAHVRAFVETHEPIWRGDLPPWTLANFFGVTSQLKLIPLTKQTPMPSGAESYVIGGQEFWRMKDGQELPFEKAPKKVLCSLVKNGAQTFWHFSESAIPEGWSRCEIQPDIQTQEPISERTQELINGLLLQAPAPKVEEIKQRFAPVDRKAWDESMQETKRLIEQAKKGRA